MIIYYNSEIWHLQALKSNLKQKLLSASANAIKACIKNCTNDISFIDLHNAYKRATPVIFLLYKHTITLFKLINDLTFTTEWVTINFNQILTLRQTKFLATKANKRKVGLNTLAIRVYKLNNRIPLEWFNMSFDTFKVHSKKEFVQ